MIDAHAHLDKYGSALPEALQQIRTHGIRTLAVSMDVASFRETQRIARAESLILPSFGIHPWEAPRFASDLAALEAPLGESTLIGEIGLDHRFVEDEALYPAQRLVFEHFLDAAEATGRLVNLHTTGAEAEVLERIECRSLPAIVVHWYSGPTELVDRFLSLGAYFTVGVEILHSDRIRELAAVLPPERLLTETDNPGGWQWLKGEPGMPDLIGRVEAEAARVRGEPQDEFSARVEKNFVRALQAGGIDPPPI